LTVVIVYRHTSGRSDEKEVAMSTRVQSTVLLAQDLDRAARFYVGLGLRIERRLDEEGLVIVDAGGSALWLYGRAEGVEKARYPICVLAVEDLESSRKRVEEHGGKIVSDLQEDPLGTNLYFRDTEGNLLEIRQPPPAGHGV
jgi:predicted enzyme related to lactoylglutathione lyase